MRVAACFRSARALARNTGTSFDKESLLMGGGSKGERRRAIAIS